MTTDTGLGLRIEQQGADWLAGAESQWNELLDHSSADVLFMSWAWQYLWWLHFGAAIDAKPTIFTATSDSGELIAIAPFLLRPVGGKRGRHARQLAPIGNVWRTNVGEVTEHTDWILRRGREQEAADAIAAHIAAESTWDELLFAYTETDSHACRALLSHASKQGWYVRRERPISSFAINTGSGFDGYLSRLGANTRRRLIGKRSVLNRLGEHRLKMADRGNLDGMLENLAWLTQLRWRETLAQDRLGFLKEIAGYWLRHDNLRFSILEVAGRPVSALFDVQIQGTVYNIRSALDSEFSTQLSPGWLHLGFAIENAFSDPDVHRYSLLAGPGKNTNYKSAIAAVECEFFSFQIIRRADEKFMFWIYDKLKQLSPFGYR